MAKPAPTPLLKVASKPDQTITLDERRTPELIIGIVGPIGSGVSYTANIIEKIVVNRLDTMEKAATAKMVEGGN